MLTETNSTIVRNLTRMTVVAGGLALGAVASPAFAAPPMAWEETDNGSLLHALLLLVGIPLAVTAVLVLLTVLPDIIRSRSAAGTSLAFQDKPEWFGGPRQGADATDDAAAERADTGGASARF